LIMPIIPLEFDPPSYDYEESGHLTWENDEASHWITWPLIGAKLFTPKDGMSVNLNEIKRLNTHQFSFYGSHGYSVDQFHEFFVEVLPKHISINFANVEVTIGEVTPLGVYLFYNQYDPHIVLLLQKIDISKFDRDFWHGPVLSEL
jgi:hypothetical protein